MPYIISKIHKLLLKRKKTLSVVESCTGGLLSKLLTDIPGSSQYFSMGIVAYSNKVKQTFLKIPGSLIAKNGAVSDAVAQGMAKSARKIIQTDIGIGLTGIAGPTGATAGRPKGTVFIAIDTKNKKICKKFHFLGSRAAIRKKTALKALQLLRVLITNKKSSR